MKNLTRNITSLAFIAALCMSLFGCGVEPTDATQDFTNAQELGSIEGTLASTCSLDTVGTTETCMNPSDWKTQVGAMCAAAGGTLGVIGYADDCGEGRWRQAKFQCCGAEAPTTPEATCSTAVIGSADICMGTAAWNNALQNKCVSEGGNLTNVSFGAACTGGHSFATYTCCNDPASTVVNSPTDTEIEQVDPAPVCTIELLGTGNTCETEEYWKAEGAAKCGSVEHYTDDIVLGAACGNDTYSFASTTCCPQTTDKVTPPIHPHTPTPSKSKPGSACKKETLNIGCMSAANYKAHADRACIALGGRVASLGVSKQCKPGLWAHAEYTCCEAKPDAKKPEAAPTNSTVSKKHAAPTVTLPKPALVCDLHTLGSKETCYSDDEWQTLSREFCGRSGARPQGIKTQVECKGGQRFAEVTCCQQAERCARASVMTDQCLSRKEALKAANVACEAAGGVVTRFSPIKHCGHDGIEQYAFQCCGN